MIRGRYFASLLALALLVAAPFAQAGDSMREIIDHKVPALKDGSPIALGDIQRVILDACSRRKFRATVVSPGVITARRGLLKSVEVTIAYTESSYSIRYRNSKRMDYDAATHSIDMAFNEYVAGLSEHIEADLGRTRERLNSYQKPLKRPGRFNPRTAV